MNMEAVNTGQEFIIKEIKGKNNPVVKKLYAMGVKEGIKSKMLLKNGRVFLIRVNNSRVVVDKDIARLIEVS